MYSKSFSQLDLIVEELIVSNVIVQLSDNTIIEGSEDGPYLNLNCVIKNTSDSIIKLHPLNSKFILNFNYKGDKYNSEIIAFVFDDSDIIVIQPNEFLQISLGEHLLLGTPILVENKYDYTFDMLEILPTIKLIYEEKNIKIKSTEINRVTVNSW